MDNYELIKEAILNKKQLIATYNNRERHLCPHVLGKKGIRDQALFYQFGGESSSGLEPDGSPNNWRCMFLDELSDIQLQDGEWHTAPNHSRPQTCVDDVEVEVQF